MIYLTEKETAELKSRFGTFKLNESADHGEIVHTLYNGKIVKGYVNENGCLFVNSVSTYLCG